MKGGVVQQTSSNRMNGGVSTASFQMTGGVTQSTALLETTGRAAEPNALPKVGCGSAQPKYMLVNIADIEEKSAYELLPV
jgi:hypothetical protein